jgi:hypothetical protein
MLALPVFAGAAQPPRRRRKVRGKSKGSVDQKPALPQFKFGTQARVFLNGDEAKQVPGLARSGIIKDDSMVLGFDFNSYATQDEHWDVERRYKQCIAAGDSAGVEILLSNRKVARVPVGTRVLVIDELRLSDLDPSWGPPIDWRYMRFVRVTEGPQRGLALAIPTRNLAEPGEPSEGK